MLLLPYSAVRLSAVECVISRAMRGKRVAEMTEAREPASVLLLLPDEAMRSPFLMKPCRCPQVECAISRATKEKRVAELTEALEASDVAFAVRYNKVSVKNFEAFRRALPADAKLYVAKNTLMKQAVSRVSQCNPPPTHYKETYGCPGGVCSHSKTLHCTWQLLSGKPGTTVASAVWSSDQGTKSFCAPDGFRLSTPCSRQIVCTCTALQAYQTVQVNQG